ncbi:hypothetical protein H0G86_000948 [Trichoderma simmonsii]|uniref:Uncharacterized protein n=1 Tax=Trichoderma simmonsii TaxID=1491479 RepID=A0A8G0L0M5_9HYPO|nr:hypothetical protein H0G86_000948 [Trichoderma simmonsii]
MPLGTLREMFSPTSISFIEQANHSVRNVYFVHVLSSRHEHLLVTPIELENRNSSHRHSGELNRCYVKTLLSRQAQQSSMLNTAYTRSKPVSSASHAPGLRP